MAMQFGTQQVAKSGEGWFTRFSDLFLAALLAAIVALMILPMPLFILDSLLAVNIALGVILVLMAIYVTSSLQFSVFPSVLLISTLFRLALSVATTRMILLNGDAGNIINTFGNLVAGGNIVVGMVVFLIITVVQFLVIAKGAERVAEVGARFTLDAMPGKQMSIDSDLRSGLIDKHEAKRKREDVELESQLHGSMDGAMKFVKGDAIAGIVIILVNLIGGLTIGISQLDMSAGAAMSKYSILTIGDGMVAQIPALFGAMAAGLIVTRVSPESARENLGVSMHKQFTAIPRVLIVAGVISAMFALVPGFPTITFLVLGMLLISAGAMLIPAVKTRVEQVTHPTFDSVLRTKRVSSSDVFESDDASEIRHTVPLMLQLPASMANAGQDVKIKNAAGRILNQYQSRVGLHMPKMSFSWDAERDGVWQLYGFEVPIATGQVDLANPLDSLSAQLEKALVGNGHLFIGIQEVSELMALTAESYPDIVKEAVRAVPMQNLARILKNLVQEDMPIRNLRAILEALVNASDREKDYNTLTEIARVSLARETCHRYAPNGILTAITFSPQLEEALCSSLRETPGTQQLALDPTVANTIRNDLLRSIDLHQPAAIVTRSSIRRPCVDVLGCNEMNVPVLSYSELIPTLDFQILSRLDTNHSPKVRSVEN